MRRALLYITLFSLMGFAIYTYRELNPSLPSYACEIVLMHQYNQVTVSSIYNIYEPVSTLEEYLPAEAVGSLGQSNDCRYISAAVVQNSESNQLVIWDLSNKHRYTLVSAMHTYPNRIQWVTNEGVVLAYFSDSIYFWDFIANESIQLYPPT